MGQTHGTHSGRPQGPESGPQGKAPTVRIETASQKISEEDVPFDLDLPEQTAGRLSQHDFRILKVIGKGSFGKVLLVSKKDTGTLYAMKVLKKDALIKRNQVQHTRAERRILRTCDCPFIVRMHFAFQSMDKLYLVLDYLPGGELFYHLKRERRFVEERVRLYAAELVLALEHLHERDIVYRDLKPENVLLAADGHVCLTDFGLSKEAVATGGRTKTFCGTPEYLAPEILQGHGHGKPVDWWSLGTLVYEMLVGLPPFYSTNVNTMYDKILRGELTFPAYVSPKARSILAALLRREPGLRLGGNPQDAAEIKAHPWFAGIDWNRVQRKEYTPMYQPQLVGHGDTSHFDKAFTELPVESLPNDGEGMGSAPAFRSSTQPGAGPGMQDLFSGFSYEGEDELELDADGKQALGAAGAMPPPPAPVHARQ